MDTIGTTYAKAVDELSGKIFIPALICSLFVELGPILISKLGFSFWSAYISLALAGLFLAPFILTGFIYISIWFFKGHHISDVLGILIMPLGFAGLFPDHFMGINVPFTQVTGVAVLAWSFMLVRESSFLNRLKELA